METSSKTKQILRIMHVITWIIFFGACIKTGAILFSFFVSLFINPQGAENLHLGLNLSNLYQFSTSHYVTMVLLIIVLAGLKAFVLYQVIRIFLKINMVHPFSIAVSGVISNISFVALGIGILTVMGNSYGVWLIASGVVLPNLQEYLGAGAEFLLMGVIIFIISQVFKRGIEIQSENELTV